MDSSGNFLWAKGIGGWSPNDQTSGLCINVHDYNDLIIGGKFKGQADFNPGPDSMTLTSTGLYDGFISMLDSSGNFVWTKILGGGYNDICYGVCVDDYGHIFATGTFRGYVNISSSIAGNPLQSASSSATDIFLVCLSHAGKYTECVSWGGNGNDGANAICVYNGQSLLLGGYFSNSINTTTNNGIATLQSQGGIDALVIKLNLKNMMLPLTIEQFCGLKVSAGVLLKWETENEFQTDFFEIQHSRDGKVFSTIGVSECLSAIPYGAFYHFLDNNPTYGNNYYRLKEFDQDGQYVYSKTINVINENQQNQLIVYPNPCRGAANLFSSSYIQLGTLTVRDPSGKIVLRRIDLEGQHFFLDLSELQNGLYLIDLEEAVHNISSFTPERTRQVRINLIK